MAQKMRSGLIHLFLKISWICLLLILHLNILYSQATCPPPISWEIYNIQSTCSGQFSVRVLNTQTNFYLTNLTVTQILPNNGSYINNGSSITFINLCPNTQYSITLDDLSDGCQPFPYTELINTAPANCGNSLPTTISACENENITIGACSVPDFSGMSIAWEYRQNSSYAWGPVAGETSSCISGSTTNNSLRSPKLRSAVSLPEGDYRRVLYNGSCSSQPSNICTLIVNALSSPTGSVTTQPSCQITTGTITISSPLSNNYRYSKDGVNYQLSTVFSGLAPGNYTFTTKDITTNCVSSASSIITVNAVPAAPSAPVGSTTSQPTCSIPSGTITLTSPTGASIQYSKDGTNYQSIATFGGLTPGNYTFTAKNISTNCISIASSSITVNAVPTAPSSPIGSTTIQPTCSVTTGTITLTSPTGASIQYSKDGTTYQASATFSGLSPGDYTFTTKDISTNCVSTSSSIITVNAVPTAPTAPVGSTTSQPTCSVTTGTVTLTSPTGASIQYSKDGTTYQASAIFSGLAPGNYTFTAKNTSTNCVSTASSVISVNAVPTAPTAPVGSTTSQPTCSVTTGTITLASPTGANIQYSKDGNTYQASATFSGLAPGNYTFTSKDISTNCVSSVSLIITVNAVPTAPATPVGSTTSQPTCSVTTGTITITSPTGASIQYSKDGTTYQASTTFIGLAPGNYTFTSKDISTNCISSSSSIITVNAVPTAPATPVGSTTSQPTCSVPSGTITLTSPTGANIQYSKDGTTYQASTTFIGLAPGNYTFTSKDISTNCISSSSSIITVNAVPAAPTAPVGSTTSQPTCSVTTGTITLTSPTGANIQYSKDGTTYQASTTFSGLAPGNYTFTAKDITTNCVSTSSSIITVNAVPTAPTAPIGSTISQPTCSVTTGTITLTSPTGANIQYSKDGTTYQASATFSGLASGNYTFTAKDITNNCVSNSSSIITVNAVPTAPTAPIGSTTSQPTCSVTTGTITLTSPTGASIQYSKDGTTYQASTTFSGLAPGNYTFTAKNTSTNCVSTSSAIIMVNAVPTAPTAPIGSTTIQPTCSVATGTIVLTSPSGVNIQYSKDGTTYQSSATFSGLASGNYSFTAKDISTTCVSAASSVITINAVPGAPTTPIGSTTSQPTCSVSTGTITLTSPTGASIQYSKDGTTYQASTTFSGLTPGNYTFTAKNTSTNCVSTASSIITVNAVPTSPSAPIGSTTSQPTCSVTTGTITLTSPTGANIQYSKDGTTYQASATFSGLAQGNYTFTAKDISTNCVSTASAIITVNAVPTAPTAPIGSTTSQPTCSVTTGTITLTSPTGASIQYSKDGTTYQASTTFSGLAPGNYTFTAKNTSTNCVSTASTVITVDAVPTAPTAPIGSTTIQPTCTVATGTIVLTSPSGVNIQYSKDGTTYQASATFSGLASGNYSFTAKDISTNCVSSASSIITINAAPGAPTTPLGSTTSQPTCSVTTGTITLTSPTGASIQYSKDGTTYQASTIFSGLAPGNYTFTAKNTSTNCVSTTSSIITVNAVPTAPTAPVGSTTNQPTCSVTTGTITLTSPTGANIQYSKDGATYQASATFSGLAPGNYTFTAKDISTNCVSTASSIITVNSVPTAPTAPMGSTTSQPTCSVTTGTITLTSPTGASIQYSKDGTTYQASTTFSGLAPGSYTFTAKNTSTNCVSPFSSAIVVNAVPTSPTAPIGSATIQPTCSVATGTIVLTSPSGVNIQYSKDGTTYQASATFSGLASGNYSFTAKDISTNCVSTVSSVITINAAPGAPTTPIGSTTSQPTCSVSTGTITLTSPTGANIQYSKDGTTYQASTAFSGLVPGNYTFTAKDINTNCVSTASSIMTVNAVSSAPTAPIGSTTSQPTCSVNTGTITLTSPTGTNIQYSKDGTTYQAGSTFTGLAPGNYTFTAKDVSTNCVSSASTAITVNAVAGAPTVPVGSTTIQPTCSVATGTITLTSPTGANIQYSKDGSIYQASPTFSGLQSGNYTFIAKNTSTNCISTSSSIITVNAVFGASAAPTGSTTSIPTCLVPTGTITMTSPLGGNIQYSKDGTTYQSSPIFSGLAPGNYTFTAKNTTTNCISKASIIIIVPLVPTIANAPVTSVLNQPNCSESAGVISIVDPVGTNFSFSKDGINFQSGNIFSGLAPGNYTFKVKDTITKCVSPASPITLTSASSEPPVPIGTIVQPTCAVSTGAINIISPIGSSYSYSKDGIVYQASPTFYGLTPGSYTIRARNAYLCESTSSVFTINPIPAAPVQPIISITQPSCNSIIGTVTISSPVGTGLEYSINNGMYQSGNSFTNLLPGNYSIKARNASLCESIPISCTINPSTTGVATPLPGVNQPTCSTSTGSISIISPTGTGIQYSLNNGAYQTSVSFAGLNPGTYTVKARNSALCESNTANFTISTSPSITATPTATLIQTSCTVKTGTITITSPVGTGFEYSLNNGIYQTNNVFSNLAPGVYTVKARKNLICESLASSFTINAIPAGPSTPLASIVTTTCTLTVGAIIITSPSGSGIQYSINNGAYQTSGLFGALPAGNYTVKARNSSLCESNPANFTISASSGPTAPIGSISQPTCSVNTGSISITSPTTTGTQYSLNGGAFQLGNGFGITFSNLVPGTYSVQVKNSSSCLSPPTTFVINSVIPTNPVLIPTQPTCSITTGSISVSSPSGTGIQYSLNGGTYQASPIFNNLAPGTYNVKAKSTTTLCESTATSTTINAIPVTPAAPSASLFQPTCSVATGSIIITSPTGSGIDYSLNNGAYQTSTTFANLAPGSYTIKSRYAVSCESTLSTFIINSPPGIPSVPSGTLVQPKCKINTGSIVITSPLGAGLKYSLNYGTFQDSTNFKNLPPGKYTVRARNASLCESAVANFVITPAIISTPTTTATVVMPTCSTSTGTIKITNPLKSKLKFSIIGGSYTTDTIFSNLLPGTYRLISIDTSTLCISDTSKFFTINAVPFPPALTLGTPYPSPDLNTWSVSFVAGGTVISNIGVLNGNTIINIPIDSSRVSVTAISNGCQTVLAAYRDTFTSIDVDTSIIDVACNGQSTGSIHMDVSGGQYPYTFDWLDIPGAINEQNRDNLSKGFYSVIITDAYLQQVSLTLEIKEPSALSITTLTTTNSISASGSGGTAPYAYDWQDIPGVFDTSYRASIPGGNYTLILRDSLGCSTTKEIVVLNNHQINLVPTITNPSCPGSKDGSISFIGNSINPLNGSTDSITITWPDGLIYGPYPANQTKTRATLGAGTYHLKVHPTTGPTSDDAYFTFELKDPLPIHITEKHNSVNCQYPTSGYIDISVTGGTAPYTYRWNDGATTEDRSGLHYATYTVEVTDYEGCKVTSDPITTYSFNVNGKIVDKDTCIPMLEPRNENEIIQDQEPPCTFIGVDLGPEYCYSWQPSGLFDNPYNPVQYVCPIPGTIYTLTIANKDSIIKVISYNTCNLTFNLTDSIFNICPSGRSLKLGVKDTLASYKWYDPYDNVISITDTARAYAGGLYKIKVTDSLGCIAVKEIFVTENCGLNCIDVPIDQAPDRSFIESKLAELENEMGITVKFYLTAHHDPISMLQPAGGFRSQPAYDDYDVTKTLFDTRTFASNVGIWFQYDSVSHQLCYTVKYSTEFKNFLIGRVGADYFDQLEANLFDKVKTYFNSKEAYDLLHINPSIRLAECAGLVFCEVGNFIKNLRVHPSLYDDCRHKKFWTDYTKEVISPIGAGALDRLYTETIDIGVLAYDVTKELIKVTYKMIIDKKYREDFWTDAKNLAGSLGQMPEKIEGVIESSSDLNIRAIGGFLSSIISKGLNEANNRVNLYGKVIQGRVCDPLNTPPHPVDYVTGGYAIGDDVVNVAMNLSGIKTLVKTTAKFSLTILKGGISGLFTLYNKIKSLRLPDTAIKNLYADLKKEIKGFREYIKLAKNGKAYSVLNAWETLRTDKKLLDQVDNILKDLNIAEADLAKHLSDVKSDEALKKLLNILQSKKNLDNIEIIKDLIVKGYKNLPTLADNVLVKLKGLNFPDDILLKLDSDVPKIKSALEKNSDLLKAWEKLVNSSIPQSIRSNSKYLNAVSKQLTNYPNVLFKFERVLPHVKQSDLDKLFSDLENPKSIDHVRSLIGDFENIPGITLSPYIPNGLPKLDILAPATWADPLLGLPASNATTFSNATAKTLSPGTKIYRVIGDNPAGSSWSYELPSGKADFFGNYAVRPEWNTATQYVEFTIPSGGLKVWDGPIARQSVLDGVNEAYFIGGKTQIYVPEPYRQAGNAFDNLKILNLPW